ncbi:hypothetical protein Rsub_06343 [Raphidocelis subcapitata]|uniref:Ionotropic glutamate receptor C-terminal domain-containing protein n=1 Tax=Raphidocelis subcapitata TaxID=307507 RepID=A0A2V0P165_9CHLO|nr:hypothetical protein Rsub_06343 [Raphidocelis subcapitata]|eukprot:GBF93621.1 hypothetical protein Rsub_06343 [Raphidocelis subcapitata]
MRQVTCDAAADPSTYDGYQIELWRRIATAMGWADSDWTFTCIDWTPMIEDLIAPDGRCTMAAAGVEVSLDNLAAGLHMSWPILKSGFQVMTSGRVQQGGTWTFTEPFHWTVWVALGGTALIISLVVAVVEHFTFGAKSNRKGLQGWSWYSWSQMMHIHAHIGDPATWGSRVLVLAYGFLIVILVHLYTATLASRLTAQRLANDVKSKADLPGKPVETWESYQGLLRKYSIDAAGLPWESDADTANFISNLRNGTYKALVLDAPVVAYLVATMNAECDLFSVGGMFETFDIAIAFPSDAPDWMVADVSREIVHMQTTQGTLDELENTYINKQGHHACSSSGAGAAGHGGSNIVVHIEQASGEALKGGVAGLWIILAITTGVGLLLAARAWLEPKVRALLGVAQAGAGPGGAAGSCAGAPPRPTFWGTTLSFRGRSSVGATAPPTPDGGATAAPSPAGAGPPSPARRGGAAPLSRLSASGFAGGAATPGAGRLRAEGGGGDAALPGGVMTPTASAAGGGGGGAPKGRSSATVWEEGSRLGV